MLLHGMWDLSSFLSGVHANTDLRAIGGIIGYGAYLTCLVALVVILRRDRETRALEPSPAVPVAA